MIQPPKGLRKEARSLWTDVQKDYALDTAGIEILRVAVWSLHRYLEATDSINESGMIFKTKSGQFKKHPCVEVAKISQAGFLASMKQLGLVTEDEDKRGPGRPV